MDDFSALPLEEAVTALSSGELTPLQLVDACLGRIDETDEVLKAWNFLDAEGARKAAGSVKPGSAPLAGIPLAVKDIFDVAGMPTTASSKVLRGNIASEDAAVVARLRRAGAIFLGKTNTQEFAYGYVTPPTANPWDPSRIPGGSSGGSAAAVAARHCPGALGSDTGGSVRVPAALCGVSGLKPRPGQAPMDGVIPLAPTLDAVGPIAHTVEGVRLMWEVMSDKQCIPAEGPFKVAIAPDAMPEIDEDVEAAYEAALEVVSGAGHTVEEIKLPAFEAFDVPRGAILMPQALEAHKAKGWWPERASDYTDETRSYMEATENFPQEVFDAGRVEAQRLVSELKQALEGFDLLVTPTAPCGAPTHEEAAEATSGDLRRPVSMRLGRIPGPINMASLAAASIPCGSTKGNLPVGLHIVGREEEAVLGLARDYEGRTDWARRRPPI
jgi:aspartyl-tRNA(Asn)/glutamyl-tRNA(Gln) amidotransferase subunit A